MRAVPFTVPFSHHINGCTTGYNSQPKGQAIPVSVRTATTGRNMKKQYRFSEQDLEKRLDSNEREAITIWVDIYRRWRERHVEFGVSLNAFCDEWQRANPYRSAGYIRKTVQVIKGVHEAYESSFDLDTIEDMGHLRQLAEDKPGKGKAQAKTKQDKSEYARTKEKAMKLSTAERRRLAEALLASL